MNIRKSMCLVILSTLLSGSLNAASIPGTAGVTIMQDGPNSESVFFTINVHYEAFDGLDATDPLGVTPGKIQFAYILEYVNGNAYMNFFDIESINGVPLIEAATSTNGTVNGLTPGGITPSSIGIWTVASGNPASRYVFLDPETEEPTFGITGDRSVILTFTAGSEYSVGSIIATVTDHSLHDGGEVVGPAEAAQCKGTIEGFVFCNDCSAAGQITPMEDIAVKVLAADGSQAASTTTNTNGKYNVTDIAAGDYTVTVDKGTLVAKSATSVGVTVSCEEPVVAAFNICPAACTQQIQVKVICDQNGAPAPKAWICLSGPQIPHRWARTKTDGTKLFNGRKIVPGHYKVTVKAPKGYELASQSTVEFNLTGCENKQLVFYACPIPPCTQSVCVQVVQPGDNNDMIPIPGVKINLNCTAARTGTTNAAGQICFDKVELGQHTLSVVVPEGYRICDGDKSVKFCLTRCEQRSAQFMLCPIRLAPCPQLPCYWKKHQAWPMISMYIGADILNKTQLMNILNDKMPNGAKPRANDITIELAQYLIAVKLSIANGSDSQDIDPVIVATDEFLLYDYPPGSGPTGQGKQLARELKNKLYDYLKDRKYCQDSD